MVQYACGESGTTQVYYYWYSDSCRTLTYISGTNVSTIAHNKYISVHTTVYTFIISLTHTNVWDSMGKPCSCTQFIKTHILYYKSCKNLC